MIANHQHQKLTLENLEIKQKILTEKEIEENIKKLKVWNEQEN